MFACTRVQRVQNSKGFAAASARICCRDINNNNNNSKQLNTYAGADGGGARQIQHRFCERRSLAATAGMVLVSSGGVSAFKVCGCVCVCGFFVVVYNNIACETHIYR